jgi:guanylate kinase
VLRCCPPPPHSPAGVARLRGRGTEKEEAIAKRLAASTWELEQSKSPIWNARIVNNDLDSAYAQLKCIVKANCMP